jgi:hypothetical protein
MRHRVFRGKLDTDRRWWRRWEPLTTGTSRRDMASTMDETQKHDADERIGIDLIGTGEKRLLWGASRLGFPRHDSGVRWGKRRLRLAEPPGAKGAIGAPSAWIFLVRLHPCRA